MRTRDLSKENIVKVKTIELIGKEGFEGFSVNKLAKACSISVATIYIYYKDKDDLLTRIGTEHILSWNNAMLHNFDPNISFEEGLKYQWKNRVKFHKKYPYALNFFDKMKNSSYQEKVFAPLMQDFKMAMQSFITNAINNKEITPILTPEIFYCMAYAPLNNLIQFENMGKSIGGKPFKLTDKILWRTFELVIIALKA